MTQLLNLESYIECCQYSYEFGGFPNHYVPKKGKLPNQYKSFLEKHIYSPFLKQPTSGDNLNIELAASPESQLNSSYIGTQLDGNEKKQLYIIPDRVDLFTLSTSGFLKNQETYLYRSAYHYWNHFSEISLYKFTKPLVFIDLDSFGNHQLVSITPDSQQIPILNTQEVISVGTELNPIQSYNEICRAIALNILNKNFPSLASQEATINHLTQYLQKQSIFDQIPIHTTPCTFPLIVELSHQNCIFYKRVSISTEDIKSIVTQKINLSYLISLAGEHSDCQFVLVSKYNILPQLKLLLPKFLCLNPLSQEFSGVWQQRQQSHLPLFGIYLDRIEFEIGTGRNSSEWIQLADEADSISYEGRAKILTGRISKNNQEVFRIPNNVLVANLPIKVNGEHYCVNDMPQAYSIKTEELHRDQDTEIQIEFYLKPGSFPELIVTDLSDKSRLETYLAETKIIPLSYSYIPPEEISQNRRNKSLEQVEHFKTTGYRNSFQTKLSELINALIALDSLFISRLSVQKIERLIALFKKASQDLQKNKRSLELLQYLNPLDLNQQAEFHFVQQQFNNSNLKKIPLLLKGLIKDLKNPRSREMKRAQKQLINELLKFIGKTYSFSSFYIDSYFSSELSLKEFEQHKINSNELLQALTRIGTTVSSQKSYFNLFDDYYKVESCQYLWGYARILLWYYDFEYSSTYFNYKEHFIKIAEYLLTKSTDSFNAQYKQNAFLALIYLLTFQDKDNDFFELGSREWEIANKVIENFKTEKVFLKQVSLETPLNETFKDLIEGTATKSAISNLIQA